MGLILSCGIGVVIYISVRWVKNKKPSIDNRNSVESTSALSNPRWLRVGKVKELYFYPLKSGRGQKVTECKFTEFGISLNCDDDQFTLRDR